MPYDYSKLSGLIVEKCQTQSAFSRAIGLFERTVSLKMNGKLDWKQQEILQICSVLGIDPKDIPDYFFTMKVQ